MEQKQFLFFFSHVFKTWHFALATKEIIWEDVFSQKNLSLKKREWELLFAEISAQKGESEEEIKLRIPDFDPKSIFGEQYKDFYRPQPPEAF